MSELINKAIKKIDEECEKLTIAEIDELGRYVKQVILINDYNAAKVLEINKDLCTFLDRLNDVASHINKNIDSTDIAQNAIKIILGIDQKQDIPAYVSQKSIETLSDIVNKTNYNNNNYYICLSSNVIGPLLQIYMDVEIIENEIQSKASSTKKTGFKTVSLDD